MKQELVLIKASDGLDTVYFKDDVIPNVNEVEITKMKF